MRNELNALERLNEGRLLKEIADELEVWARQQ